MRILMVTQFYAPIVGGEERIVEDLSSALVRRGHRVAVAALRQDGLAPFEEVDGVRVHRIESTLRHLGPLFTERDRRHAPPACDPGARRSLQRVLEREQPDLVHAHNWLVHSILPLTASADVPIVLSLHDYSLVCANKRLIRNGVPCEGPELVKCLSCAARYYGPLKGVPTALAVRRSGRRARAGVDMFLPVSDAVARASGVAGSGVPHAVVPNFVSDRSLAAAAGPAVHTAGLPPPPFVLFAGDLTHDKGIDTLLAAHAAIGDAPPLVLVGRTYSPAVATARPNVRVLGLRDHGTVLEAARRSAVTVVPSLLQESFGLIALEAMAMGTPVVAARSGALPEIVEDGETGVIVPAGDVDALRAALARLLSDPALRERMGSAARRRAEQFSERAVVPRVERIYSDLAGRQNATNGAALATVKAPSPGRRQEATRRS